MSDINKSDFEEELKNGIAHKFDNVENLEDIEVIKENEVIEVIENNKEIEEKPQINSDEYIQPTLEQTDEINFSQADDHDYHHIDNINPEKEIEEIINDEFTQSTEKTPITPIFPVGDVMQKEEILNTQLNSNNFYTETVKNEGVKNKKNKFKKIIAITLVASIFGGSFLGIGLGVGNAVARKYIFKEEENKTGFYFTSKAEPISQNQTNSESSSILNNSSFASVIKNVKPSVVCITATQESERSLFSVPDLSGAGSGIIFTQDADLVYVATNYHVVSGATKVGVVIGSSESVEATLVGKEPQSDLAVISIKKTDLEKVGVKEIVTADFGSSEDMQVGDIVFAIGNALGEGTTATFGILSATDKTIVVEGKELLVVQTDAAINPGNSGGALLNSKGEVIGINTAKLLESKIEGMGYSISSDIAKPILEKLMTQEPSPVLGITGSDMTPEIANLYNLPQIGIIVKEVIEGSNAQTAGIKPSDIITSFNNSPTVDMKTLIEGLKNSKIGDTIKIKLLREGKEVIEMDVVLKESKGGKF